MANTPYDLAELIPKARAGSPQALGAVLEACRLYLLGIADRELAGPLRAKGSASDLVQETFLEAQCDFVRFRGQTEAELLAWLRQMLLNNLGNFARRYRETDKRRIDREIPIQGSDSAASMVTPQVASATPTPSRQMIAEEETVTLRAALERLPEDYRRVLTLRYLEERRFDEIATMMGRTSNAVRLLWARAVERMQEEMDAHS
jgi:RNA polymerase sigma-70 factor (ECF subfamily)